MEAATAAIMGAGTVAEAVSVVASAVRAAAALAAAGAGNDPQ